MLLQIANGNKQTVRKSKTNEMVNAITSLAKAVQKQNSRQDMIAKTLGQLMEVQGITSQIAVVKKSQEPVRESNPVHTGDLEALSRFIAKSISNPTEANKVEKSQSEKALEEMGDILSGFRGLQSKQTGRF
jgi:hypothetical protein